MCVILPQGLVALIARLTVDHLRCLFLAVPLPAAAVQGCGVVGAL